MKTVLKLILNIICGFIKGLIVTILVILAACVLIWVISNSDPTAFLN
jgi:hypothetical protein